VAGLDGAQLFALAQGAGFSSAQARIMAAIALGESGGNPAAVGDEHLVSSTWGPSIGLWQVRSLNAQRGTGQERDGSRLADPSFNARSARTIYTQQGYRAWTVYNTGAYGKHLADVDKSLAGGSKDDDGFGIEDVLWPGGLIPGVKDPLDGLGGQVVDAGKGALGGLDAIGAFAASLGQRGTWVRVLQVVGGSAMVAGGLLLLGRDVVTPVASAAADFVPGARAVKAAAGAAKAAT
jgi:hypothetical protein